MSIIIPHELKELIYKPGVKKAFISDGAGANHRSCPNCGGVGTMYLFLAYEGPYERPSADLSKISHFYDGGWWAGESYAARCQVCKGSGKAEGDHAKAQTTLQPA